MECKHLLAACPYQDDAVTQELSTLLDEIADNSNANFVINERCLDFFSKNINSDDPLPIITLLSKIKLILGNDTDKKSESLDEFIWNELENLFKKLEEPTDQQKYTSRFLNIFIHFECANRLPNLIEKLRTLSNLGFTKEVYYALVIKNNECLLEEFINDNIEQNPPLLWKPEGDVIIDLTISSKKHWISEMVANCTNSITQKDEYTEDENLFVKYLINLSIIHHINQPHDDSDLTSYLSNLNKLLDKTDGSDCNESVSFYIDEIKRENKLLQFCIRNTKKKSHFGWLNQVLNHSALSFVSQNCDMSSLDSSSFLELLQNNNNIMCKLYELPKSESPWDVTVYKSYCIITSIIDLILTCSVTQDDTSLINSKLEEIKILYLSITSIEDKIEILENIFVCLFLRTEYFCDNHVIQNGKPHFIRDGFICSRALVKKILYFLKNCLNEIQEYCVVATINKDFAKLQKHVTDSIWKYQTITTLKIDTNIKSSQHTYLYDDILDHSSDDESKSTLKRKLRMKKRRKSSNDSGTDPPKDATISPTQEKFKFVHEDFVSLMLSPPSTLLCLCLENTDFSRANKIIDLYSLHNMQEANEVKFTENYLNTVMQIKQQFKKTDNIPHTETLTETSALAATVISLIETFLSSNTQYQDPQITELSRFHSELYVYNQKHLPLLAITDLAISTGLNKNITYGIMNIAEKKLQEVINGDFSDFKHWNCIIFIKNMINLVYDLDKNTNNKYNNFSMCDILRCDKLPLKYKNYQLTNDFFEKISLLTGSITNATQKLNMKSLTDLFNLCNKQVIDLCSPSNSKNSNSTYLKHLLTYAKSIYELINLHTKESDSEENQSDFLKLHLHEVISQLIVDDKVPLENIESVCKLLGIDFIQKLVLNICPTIECFRRRSSRDCNFMEILLEIDDQSPSTEFSPIPITLSQPLRKIMIHILIHNWIIGYLVKRIHSDNTDYILKESVDTRTKFLDAYLSLERFNNLKALYGNNNIITALQTTYNSHNLKLLIKDVLKRNEFDQCLQILNSLPVYYFNLHPTLLDLKDEILLNMARNIYLKDNWKYFLKISNHELQIRNLFEILQFWTASGVKEVLNFTITNFKFRDNTYIINECKTWLSKIPIYEQIAKVHEYSNWNEMYKLSMNDPESVLQLLMDENHHKLCLKWLNIHSLSNNVQNLVTFNYLKMILKSQEYITASELKDILAELPREQSSTLLLESISKIKDINLLNICIDFLTAESESSKLENIRIGIQILEILDEKERTFFWDIINQPLLIIEQYLMNAKFDRLSKILNKIRPQLKQDPYGDNLFFNINIINTCLISNNSVDALLRLYAAKSLDLRTTKVNQDLQITRKTDELTLQSIDSINLLGEAEKFVMPEVIPMREQWISNDFSESCMSCKTTIFSILIRKHHCRRCGRLVCYYCSRSRMQIENMYDGIKVRVCNDCHTQTINKSNQPKNYSITSVTSTGSIQSEQLSMEWCLTANVKHNHEIRREFSYEFSPNVTLFLTIMKMHTVNFDYQRFLNEKSSDLLKSAKELGENKTGCDNICELLKMRKTLLIWCTVLYSQPSLITSSLTNAAIEDTENQLAATDALTLLASHGYHYLIPQIDTPNYKSHSQKSDLYSKLFAKSIRKLLEDEKWDLALEISMKFGFPRNSVLAAWGKACLRAGCFESARQKFSFCFKKSGSTPGTSEILNVSSTTIQQDIYKTKTKPLLEEIIVILENGSYVVNSQIIKKADTIKVSQEKLITEKKPNKKVDMNEPAINIMHSLSSIQKLKVGDYSDFSTAQLYVKKSKSIGLTRKASGQNEKLENKLVIDKYFYDECLYYLTTYGSHSLILEFYLKYDNLNDALNYCYENAVEKEIFTEFVFYNCSRAKKTSRLLSLMNEIDPTWNKWADYIIHFCRSLEHKGSLEALHIVQVGIGDYVRAAITCANLYKRPTVSPHANALYKRAHYLIQAQTHLQCVPRKLSDPGLAESTSRSLQLKMDAASLNKHINTFHCQIKVAAFLNACELKGNLKSDLIVKILSSSTIDDAPKNECFLPTLFSDHSKKIQLAALIIVCASDISEGFNLTTKVIREQNLDPTKVFSIAVRSLVSVEKYENIIKVCELIVNEKKPDSRQVCDTIVEISIGAIVRKCDSQKKLFDELAEVLIQKVENIGIKISCYIECRLLKSAYSLAVKNERIGDLRRIMREAEKLGQIQVKNACGKRLEKMSS